MLIIYKSSRKIHKMKIWKHTDFNYWMLISYALTEEHGKTLAKAN